MKLVKNGDIIAVWFSCGVASAVAAKLAVEKYSDIADVRVINNPIKEEDFDNIRFLKDVEKWIGKKIEFALNPKYIDFSAESVWDDKQFMSSPYGAPCTVELKKRAREHWEKENKPDWHVLGFTYDEIKRHDKFVLTERDNIIPILINEKLTKNDCFKVVKSAGIELPNAYKYGYPNANCIGCVKATSPTYWNLVREKNPDVFYKRAEQSRRIGAKLVRVKGKRIFLDQLSPKAKGASLKKYDMECGLFCEEFIYEKQPHNPKGE